jgi:hypothetical protein
VPAFIEGDIPHALAMGHIDEVERGARGEVLLPGLHANVSAQVRQQSVLFWIVQPDPIRHCGTSITMMCRQ